MVFDYQSIRQCSDHIPDPILTAESKRERRAKKSSA